MKKDYKKSKYCVLGISCFYHDSAASLVIDGIVVAAAQEERFTRKKHTPDFPKEAIKYCLKESGYSISDISAIVFYDKPLLKFERLLQTYYSFSPRGLFSFLKAIPVWLDEKLFIKNKIIEGLSSIEYFDKKKLNLLFTEHHLSHAASSFFSSSVENSAILTIDGVGEWCTSSIGIGSGNNIKILKEMHFPHSVGLLYSAFTYFLGFKVNSGEYKLMGLAPYGNRNSNRTLNFIELIKKNLVNINNDGSIWLNQKYFSYATSLKMISEKKWEKLFGFPLRNEELKLEQHHCDLALAIQNVTEEIVIKLAKHTKEITKLNNLCLAGGVALNCVANGKILNENIFDNIYIQPASGDSGGSLGAALAIYHMNYDQPRKNKIDYDIMGGSYLGPEFSENEISNMNKIVEAVAEKEEVFSLLAEKVASLIANGKIIGWFQGRMEFGPRALGNRSILADPRNPEMQKKLNLKIKYREGFRPFAPSVLFEDVNKFFKLKKESPYMLVVDEILSSKKKKVPSNYEEMSFWDKLYCERSEIQSITHVDFSARIQTVKKEFNFRYWTLINEFKKQTGCSILVNTSFNVRGEPIVLSPFDAYRCFMATEMDYLVIGDFIYKKEEQVNTKKSRWQKTFSKD